MTTRNQGVPMATTMGTVTTRSKVTNQFWKLITICVSMVSISFEKRFRIRPSGVTSKNSIGAVRMLPRRRRCKVLPARIPPRKSATQATRMNPPRTHTTLYSTGPTLGHLQHTPVSISMIMFPTLTFIHFTVLIRQNVTFVCVH